MWRRKTAFVTVLLLGVGDATAQTQQAPGEPVIKAGAEEVVLDVVVRDKKGRSVNDLQKDDFSVTDAGQKVEIKSFRRVEGAEAVSTSGQRTKLDPLRQVRLLTLIFERLSMNGRTLARQAAADLLKTELPQNVYATVVTLNQRMDVLQSFTNDRELLKKAIDKATSGETEFHSDTAQMAQQLQQLAGPNTSGQSLAEQVANMPSGGGNGPGGAPNGGGEAAAAMAQIMQGMLEFAQRTDNAMIGRTSIYALLDLVNQEKRLPGRKTVLYFSEGFTVPQGTEKAFESVMATANAANVSFYTIDARGLDSTMTGAGRGDLAAAAAAARSQTARTAGAVTGSEARATDTAIEGLRADKQTTLHDLAVNTGGELIANSNDFRARLRRVAEDIESYYEISYAPHIEKYDASLRKVSVEMSRADLRVQSRNGYFALPPGMANGAAVLGAYEVPLLNALNATPAKRDFPHSAAGLHFIGPSGGPECAVVIDVMLSNIALAKEEAGDRYKGQFSYMAVVKDTNGGVVKKFAGEIPVNFPKENLEAAKASHFIYSEHANLPPGRYRLETVVMDMTTEKVSTRKASFLVPTAGGLSISSVSMVRSVKDAGADSSDADPFNMGKKVVTPVLNPEVKKSETQGLPFYVVVYLDPKMSEKPELTMTFSRDGQTLGSAKPELTAPDSKGRIQYIATAPVATLEPGRYEVEFLAKQGQSAVTESVGFTLEP